MKLKRADFGDLSSEVFARGSLLRFRAGGRSMHPLVQDGDILTIEPVDPASLRVGDVAFYRPSRDLVVAHRVVARCVEDGKLVYLIRGDASPGPCERVPAECILGRAVLLERNGRKVRLDRGIPRLVGLLWVKLSPWSNNAYACWTGLLRFARRVLRKAARIVASRLLHTAR